jgi:hypothetical protein
MTAYTFYYIYAYMKRLEVSKLATVLLMISLFVMGVYIPAIYPPNYTGEELTYEVKVSSINHTFNGAKGEIPSLIDLFEEEEVENTQETHNVFAINLEAHQIIAFSSPNLFFKEHFKEVSGPPPWC